MHRCHVSLRRDENNHEFTVISTAGRDHSTSPMSRMLAERGWKYIDRLGSQPRIQTEFRKDIAGCFMVPAPTAAMPSTFTESCSRAEQKTGIPQGHFTSLINKECHSKCVVEPLMQCLCKSHGMWMESGIPFSAVVQRHRDQLRCGGACTLFHQQHKHEHCMQCIARQVSPSFHRMRSACVVELAICRQTSAMAMQCNRRCCIADGAH